MIRSFRAAILSMLMLAAMPISVPAQPYAATQVCNPPVEPWVPQSDDELAEFVDLIAADFEKYFLNLSSYFACIDASRQAVFERSRKVSDSHEVFWQRAKALGVARQAASIHEQEAIPE